MPELLPRISVLFITYNRLVTLGPTLDAFLTKTDYPRDLLELVCCDDCSPPTVQRELRRMPFDIHCLAAKRRGLGANVNQGLRAATCDLVLQLQDDWECTGPADYLLHAVSALESVSEVGMVILKRHPNDLLLHSLRSCSGGVLRVFANRPEVKIENVGEHAYTDWPHLKRRSFHEKLGAYAVGVPMWEMELEFSRRVNAQKGTFVADIEGLNAFHHIGEDYSHNWPWKKRLIAAASRVSVLRSGLDGLRTMARRLRRLK